MSDYVMDTSEKGITVNVLSIIPATWIKKCVLCGPIAQLLLRSTLKKPYKSKSFVQFNLQEVECKRNTLQ